MIKITKWEYLFLKYYLNNYNAKWLKVYNNKHPLLETVVDLYTVYKRKLKIQAEVGVETHTGMFKYLKENEWYFIPNLLEEGEIVEKK